GEAFLGVRLDAQYGVAERPLVRPEADGGDEGAGVGPAGRTVAVGDAERPDAGGAARAAQVRVVEQTGAAGRTETLPARRLLSAQQAARRIDQVDQAAPRRQEDGHGGLVARSKAKLPADCMTRATGRHPANGARLAPRTRFEPLTSAPGALQRLFLPQTRRTKRKWRRHPRG